MMTNIVTQIIIWKIWQFASSNSSNQTLSMELFSARRWRLVSAQLSNKFGVVPHELSILFFDLINTTDYPLRLYAPSSPSTKELHALSICWKYDILWHNNRSANQKLLVFTNNMSYIAKITKVANRCLILKITQNWVIKLTQNTRSVVNSFKGHSI